ncbi:MAG: WecB/TagA/CpsF family glycosyltransferase [Phycisphaerae bacterium]|nr:WecB/TagA/CpsF family glycosyltransferase [Phycisphaerae bacterium]
MSRSERKRCDVLGVPVDPLTMRDVLAGCEDAIRSRSRLLIGVVNAAKIVRMREDPDFSAAVTSSDLVLADGMAVVWAARLLGQPLPERIAGIDLFEGLLRLADAIGARVYLLGARQDVLDTVVRKISTEHPRVRIVGAHDGYFRDAEVDTVVEDIRASQADMLFVAMSPPKKEFFIAKWGPALGVPVCHGVGGSFDVLAGRTQRAPEWMQRAGLEWFHRVLQEPARLWRRYLTTNASFAGILMAELVSRVCRVFVSRKTQLASPRRSDNDLSSRSRS